MMNKHSQLLVSRYSDSPRKVSARVLALLAFALATSAPAATTPAQFDKTVRPLLKEYCLGCHSAEKHKGDLDLERFSSLGEVKKHPKVWQAVAEQLASNEMPPKEKPQPTAAQREKLLAWVNTTTRENFETIVRANGKLIGLRHVSDVETAVITKPPRVRKPLKKAA